LTNSSRTKPERNKLYREFDAIVPQCAGRNRNNVDVDLTRRETWPKDLAVPTQHP
jgi:hypothetical protein